MNSRVRHLSVADVMTLHQIVMERTGSAPAPIRDAGLLESAVLKPRMADYYEGADLVRQAALLAVGISQNQPYLDGNKRAAYFASAVFLDSNGSPFRGDPLEFARQLELLAERTDSLEAATGRFEAWLRENTG